MPPISYDLPYPGILPDSPFYVLKVIRDKIVEFLISDPITHANFDLLQSDKRLSAGMALQKILPQKEDVIGSTISKAENYFDEAIQQVNLARKQGIDATEVLDKLSTSNKKHREVISQIADKLSPKYKGSILFEERRMQEFQTEVDAELIKK